MSDSNQEQVLDQDVDIFEELKKEMHLTREQSINIVWTWIPDQEYLQTEYTRYKFSDIAEAYAIALIPQATNGFVVYARYRVKWKANPWNTRPIIQKLLANQGLIF